MAEFFTVMKKFKKMCKNGTNCENCPLENCLNEAEIDPEHFEEAVMNWNEPIYPTILELLSNIALEIPNGKNMPLNELVKQHLPEKKAKEFGILPINMRGLTKYVNEEESEWR